MPIGLRVKLKTPQASPPPGWPPPATIPQPPGRLEVFSEQLVGVLWAAGVLWLIVKGLSRVIG